MIAKELKFVSSINHTLSLIPKNKILELLSANYKDLFIATVIVVGIFWMPIVFDTLGISITGMFEEAVGYRYFYSLRIAFGHEAPWLPQGQLVTLYHVGLQYLLTLLGLPNEQLYPRIDVFSTLSHLPPILLTWFASIRLSKNFNFKAWPLLIAAIFIFMMHSSNLPGGPNWTLTPDYEIWVIPLAILSASLISKKMILKQQDDISIRWFVGMGLFIGIAGGIKITYILFPGTILMAVVVNRWNQTETIKFLLISTLISVMTLGVIFWASTGFSKKEIFINYIAQSISFFKTPSAGAVAGNEQIFSETLLPFILSMIVLCLGIIAAKGNIIIIGATGLVYSVIVCLRFYSHSLIEYHAFLLIPLITQIHLYSDRFNDINKMKQIAMIGFPSIVILITVSIHNWPVLRDTPDFYRRLNSGAMKFHHHLAAGENAIWILTTENTYRPNSIESALCKGGMDINHAQWGDSPYITRLFPQYHCAVYARELPQKDKQAISNATVGFSHWGESLQSAIHRVETAFHISLVNADCKDVSDNIGSPLTYCYPKYS